jgi:hypothetical protein
VEGEEFELVHEMEKGNNIATEIPTEISSEKEEVRELEYKL